MTRPLDQIVAAVQAEQSITWHEFCLAANRTASKEKFPSGYPADLAVSVMEQFTYIGQELDKLKKALFYGKNVPELVAAHRVTIGESDQYSGEDWPDNISPDIIHWILGEATESVELVEALIKGMVDGESLDAINLMEEEGDGHWYRALPYIHALETKGFDPEERKQLVWRKVLLKLITRYGDKLSATAAIERNTNLEREVLEAGIVMPNGEINSSIEQQIILTSEPDLETARQALSALARAEQQLQDAHTEILTEAEQYLNILLLQHVLPSQIAEMDMPVLIKQQVLKMVQAASTTN
jgi:hypothetical protein